MWESVSKQPAARKWGDDCFPQEELAQILNSRDLCDSQREESAFANQVLAICKALDRNEYSAEDMESIADMCVDAMPLLGCEDTARDGYEVLSSLNSSIWTLGMTASYCALAIRITKALDAYGDGEDAALTPLVHRITELFERQILLHFAKGEKANREIDKSCKALADKLSQKKILEPSDVMVMSSLGCLMMEITDLYPLISNEPEVAPGCLSPQLLERFGRMKRIVCFEQKRQALEDLVSKEGKDDSETSISALLRPMIDMVLEEQVDAYRVSKLIDSLERTVSALSTGSGESTRHQLLFVTAISALEDDPFPMGFNDSLSHIALKAETERILQKAADLGMDKDEMDLMTELLCMMTIRQTREIDELEGPYAALNYVSLIQGLLDTLSSQPLIDQYENLLSLITEDLPSSPEGESIN